MLRNRSSRALLAAVAVIGCTFQTASGLDIVWDGGEDFWDAPNWNGGRFPVDVTGVVYGSNGYASPTGGDTFIISGPDSHVIYDADFLGADFTIKQGSGMRIEDGATWSQPTAESWAENRWTEYDGSSLIIDGGTFSRLGSVPFEGGGALIFGSWKGDDNLDHELSELDFEKIDIQIINGGRLENEGQLWFGGWEDHPPGLTVTMTIDDGELDLTGGDVPGVGDVGDADLVFTYGLTDAGVPKNENYAINFIGPGSITVDSSGIIVPVKESNDPSIWNGGFDPVTYEDLWDLGILQANGLSGDDGASFSEYFTIEGMLGQDDYRLISMVTPIVGVEGDFNGNGRVEQADLDLVLLNWGESFENLPEDWVNGRPNEGIIDQAELDGVLLNWGNMGAGLSASAVPEPATWLLLGMAAAGAAVCRRRR